LTGDATDAAGVGAGADAGTGAGTGVGAGATGGFAAEVGAGVAISLNGVPGGCSSHTTFFTPLLMNPYIKTSIYITTMTKIIYNKLVYDRLTVPSVKT
jgi:hypothetical protein